ncbi:hypothetical protein MBLNU457_4730t2 [Dothideomycetes sp. NU457]
MTWTKLPVSATRSWLSSGSTVPRKISRGSCPRITHKHLNCRRASSQAETSKPLLATLEERGFINQIAGNRDDLSTVLSTRRIAAYSGIDPTAPSLHLGHLVPLMILFWLHAYGHSTISLVGGATARVGDPTGRLTTRNGMEQSTYERNVEGITAQVHGLWKNMKHMLERRGELGDSHERGTWQVRNNREWLDGLSIVDFLRYMGMGARMGTMLGRDTVKNKMTQGDGMSFAEFSYPLLQAWDWWHMYSNLGVQMQVGGSDQYGNIIAGMDAIRYMSENHQDMNHVQQHVGSQDMVLPFGVTVPLLTTASGAKFGKSAGNAIWLDPNMTSSFDVYGFLLKSADADVERYLKLFTFVSMPEIATVMEAHTANPGKRQPQHLLAQEVLALIHGEDVAKSTAEQHRSMRKPSLQSLSADMPQLHDAKAEGDSNKSAAFASDAGKNATIHLPREAVYGRKIAQILASAGIAGSRMDGQRSINNGGVYVGVQPSSAKSNELEFVKIRKYEPDTGDKYLINDKMLVLRLGKWKVRVIKIRDE